MSMDRRRRPQVEGLESKLVLSTLLPGAKGAEVAALAAHRPLALRGVVDGAATDAGLSQALQGQGKVAPLGMVTISGSIQLPGSIANGRPTGTVTLTNARGSVTLQLIGPVQAELTATPSKFTYTVISGTGTYQGAKGSGHASLREIQVDGSAAQAGGSNQPVVVGSLFILTFSR